MPSNKEINKYLQRHGLGKLEDPNTMHQLAFLVRDHAHFRSILAKLMPAKRKLCYDAMAGNLNFTAKSLETYIAEAAAEADRQNLPLYDSETGTITERKGSLELAAEQAIRLGPDAKALTLHCSLCTAKGVFPALTRMQATQNAVEAGWHKKDGLTSCPECSSARIEARTA